MRANNNIDAWIDYQDSLRRYYIEKGVSPEEAAERAVAEVRAEIAGRRGAINGKHTSPYYAITRTMLGRWRVQAADGSWLATFRDRADALAFIEHAPPEPQL